MVSYAEDIKTLWKGSCTVTVRDSVPGAENTGRTVQVERPILVDEPCKISFKTVTTTDPRDGAARVKQSVKLYIDAAHNIPPGSKITVTQNGVTDIYEMSGHPATYSHHQEIPLDLFGGWA